MLYMPYYAGLDTSIYDGGESTAYSMSSSSSSTASFPSSTGTLAGSASESMTSQSRETAGVVGEFASELATGSWSMSWSKVSSVFRAQTLKTNTAGSTRASSTSRWTTEVGSQTGSWAAGVSNGLIASDGFTSESGGTVNFTYRTSATEGTVNSSSSSTNVATQSYATDYSSSYEGPALLLAQQSTYGTVTETFEDAVTATVIATMLTSVSGGVGTTSVETTTYETSEGTRTRLVRSIEDVTTSVETWAFQDTLVFPEVCSKLFWRASGGSLMPICAMNEGTGTSKVIRDLTSSEESTAGSTAESTSASATTAGTTWASASGDSVSLGSFRHATFTSAGAGHYDVKVNGAGVLVAVKVMAHGYQPYSAVGSSAPLYGTYYVSVASTVTDSIESILRAYGSTWQQRNVTVVAPRDLADTLAMGGTAVASTVSSGTLLGYRDWSDDATLTFFPGIYLITTVEGSVSGSYRQTVNAETTSLVPQGQGMAWEIVSAASSTTAVSSAPMQAWEIPCQPGTWELYP